MRYFKWDTCGCVYGFKVIGNTFYWTTISACDRDKDFSGDSGAFKSRKIEYYSDVSTEISKTEAALLKLERGH